MRQLVQDLGSGVVEVVEVPDPRPGPGGVLVRNRWSLISAGTERAVAETASKSMLGKARARPDEARRVLEKTWEEGLRNTYAAVRARLDDLNTPGYSSMGVVETVGSDVHTVVPGDRVACFGADAACHAERVVVPHALCLPLSDDVDDRSGAFGALGGIAAHGVRLSGLGAGELCAVVGLGLVGQTATQLATAAGARVIGIDPSEARRTVAQELGAEACASPDDALESVQAHSDGNGADVVLIAAASPTNEPIALASELARDRATVTVIGDVGLAVPRRQFFQKELALRISRSYGPGRYDPAYEEEGRDYPLGYVRWTERRLIGYFFSEVEKGRVQLAPLISHEFPIQDGIAAYEALGGEDRMAIMLQYPQGAEPKEAVDLPVASTPRAGASRTPRVALIGPGVFARSTLLPILNRIGADVVGIAGPTGARALGAARRWKVSRIVTDPRDLITDPSIELVVIASRHDSHAALVLESLAEGKAVLVEKPLAITQEEVQRIESAISRDARLVVDFNRSFAPATLAVREHFADRKDPVFVSCRVNAGYLPIAHWLRDRAQGGGRLIGEGCHFVDLCGGLVGSKLVSLQVSGLSPTHRALQGDNFVLLLRYADGSLASIAYIASGAPRMSKERIEVLGGGRSAVIDDFRQLALQGSRRGSGRPSIGPGRRDKGHRRLIEETLSFTDTGGEPPIPYDRLIETTTATIIANDALAIGDTGPQAIP